MLQAAAAAAHRGVLEVASVQYRVEVRAQDDKHVQERERAREVPTPVVRENHVLQSQGSVGSITIIPRENESQLLQHACRSRSTAVAAHLANKSARAKNSVSLRDQPALDHKPECGVHVTGTRKRAAAAGHDMVDPPREPHANFSHFRRGRTKPDNRLVRAIRARL